MLKEVIIHDRQKSQASDINNGQLYARQSFDAMVANALSHLRYFTGFAVAKTGATEVTVGPGHYWGGGPFFVREADTVFNFLQGGSYMPVIHRRIVAIVASGETIETEVQQRSFRVNDQGGTEPNSVPVQRLRRARLELVPGVEGVNPQKPSLESTIIPVAWVTLDTTTPGVAHIEMAEDYRFPSLESLNQLVKGIQAWRDQVGRAIDTLQSDLAVIQASLFPSPWDTIAWLLSKIEELESLVKQPTGAVETFIDRFRSLLFSDPDYEGYSAVVDNGLRFPGGEPVFAPIVLNNPLDPKVKVVNNILSPKWTSTRARLEIGDPDGSLSINQYTSQEVARKQMTQSRTITQYSPVVALNLNGGGFDPFALKNFSSLFSGDVSYAQSVAIANEYERFLEQLKAQDFQRHGRDTFEFRRDNGEVYTFEVLAWSGVGLFGSTNVVLRSVSKTIPGEPYWTRVTRDATVSGSQVAQTFLNANNGWLVEVGLLFDQFAVAGDVKIFVVEASAGSPDRDKVISRGTIPAASLKTDELVKCTIEPVYLQGGRSYAVIIVSTGNHFLRVRSGNKYAYGTAYYLDDVGTWVPVQNSGDICMSLFYPSYDQTRVEVLMQPLTRAGGISGIRINAAQFAPPGTQLLYEVQRAGTWYRISEGDVGALTGAPTLVNFRAVFVGTRDLMPAIDMAQTEVELSGDEDEFIHVSKVIEAATAGTDFQVELRIEGWDGDAHSIDVDLIIPGAPDTVEPADSLTITPQPDDNTSVRALAVFTPPSTDVFRVKITGVKDPGAQPFVVTERRAHAL